MTADPPAIDSLPIVETAVGLRAPTSSWEIFLRVVVVVIGIAVGAILALIIGLSTGWIQLTC